MEITRYENHAELYPEIKDPSVVEARGKWYMYASIGTSATQKWLIGRFEADSPEGPWTELAPARVNGLSGPQMCAPAVTYEEQDGKPLWRMYVQTACFEENGVIACMTSNDGRVYNGVSATLIGKDNLTPQKHEVVGLYDAGVSDVEWEGDTLTALVFSGYRSVGNGDLYMTYRKKDGQDTGWSTPRLIMAQEDVPFHNRPGSSDYEWGLEGAKIVQLSSSCYMLIGVCFAPLPREYAGHRQRIFLAASRSPFGPFAPLGVPFLPISPSARDGEQGHPDTVIVGQTLWIVYQERKDSLSPWYLCFARMNLPAFAMKVQSVLSQPAPVAAAGGLPAWERFFFDMR